MDSQMNRVEKFKAIRHQVSCYDMLIQLAEECNELSAAILKYVRKDRNANPTPLSEQEIFDRIETECTDVTICLDVMGRLYVDEDLYDEKLGRWLDRLSGKERWDLGGATE